MQQQRKLWLIFSVIILSEIALSCGSGPKLKICISDPAKGGFDCYDERTSEASFILYSESDKFTALDPENAKTLINWCGIK